MEKKAVKPASGENERKRGMKNIGLCENCINMSNCGFLANAEEAVQYCEEFSDRQETKRPFMTLVKAEDETATNQEIEENAQVAGLCRNCSKKGACNLPKSDGGIWFCEEYE